MMSNKINSGFLVAAVVALFFLASFVISCASVETAAVNVDEQPAEVTQDSGSVTVNRETTSPQPFMGDTIRQASRNWADFSEAAPKENFAPEPNMADNIRQASLNWADYAEEPGMSDTIRQASLNWADYAASALPEPSTVDNIRQASLNWADYTETGEIESAQPRSLMGDTLRQASLNWADYVGTEIQAYELPESDGNGKPY